MDYRPGSYLVTGRKVWTCDQCKATIQFKSKYFQRVKLTDPSKPNAMTYQRYHLACAQQLPDLNEYEKGILGGSVQERSTSSFGSLVVEITEVLKKYESQGKLTFAYIPQSLMQFPGKSQLIRVGRTGFPNFLVFLAGGRTLFIQLKSTDFSLSNAVLTFREQVSSLSFEYVVLESSQALTALLENVVFKGYNGSGSISGSTGSNSVSETQQGRTTA